MLKKECKYTTRFEFEVQASEQLVGEQFVSKANIQNLRDLIPTHVDLDDNIDLMGVAFNAAIVNQFNNNDDAILSSTAMDCVHRFVHKPTNIEHDKQRVVGHIVSADFRSIKDSSFVDASHNTKDPCYISLGALIYKSVDKEFSRLLDASTNPENAMYNTISASWEIGFNKFNLAIGDDLDTAEIITDADKIKALKGNLRINGGSGFTEGGQRIRRILTGKIYPLGVGFTTKPAANVNGVISHQHKPFIKNEMDSHEAAAAELEKSYAEISQKNKKTVNNSNIMDIKDLLSDLQAALVEKKFSEEAVASMTSTFAEAIKKQDQEYKDSLAAAEAEKTALATEQAELKASVESMKTELAQAQERIAGFEAKEAAAEAVARFDARMEEIDGLYELNEDDSKFIATKLKGLDASDEAFASFKEELSVFWASKNKEAVAKIKEETEARINEEVEKRLNKNKDGDDKVGDEAHASDKDGDGDGVDKALDNAQASDGQLPNNSEGQDGADQPFVKRFAKAFSRDNILK